MEEAGQNSLNREQKRDKKVMGRQIDQLAKTLTNVGQKLMQCINSVNILNDDFSRLTRLRPADVLQEGDVVVVDYFARLVNEDGSLGNTFAGGQGKGLMIRCLGNNELVSGFEEQLVGKKVGDTLEIDLTFPEDYHEHLANKKVKFYVAVLESLRENEASMFTTNKVQEYQNELQKKLEAEKAAKAEAPAVDTPDQSPNSESN
jgi:FKBP-type peptidyl-prolyl cis-trans isomerase (trigger factor)